MAALSDSDIEAMPSLIGPISGKICALSGARLEDPQAQESEENGHHGVAKENKSG